MSEATRPSASILERIRKIMAKTQEAGCTQAEAENAFALASRILTEHNLSMDDVRLSGGETEEKYVEEGIHETGRWQVHENMAYVVINEFYFVHGYFRRIGDRKKRLMIFGTEANVASARFAFDMLLQSADMLWTTYQIRNRRPGSEGRMFRTGVIKGYRDKLHEERRCQEMERDVVSGRSGGTALALVRVEDEVKKRYHEAHPSRSKKDSTTTFAGFSGAQSTMDAGYKAGKNLNINRAVSGNTQKGIGS